MPRFTLSRKLATTILIAAVTMGAFLVLYLGPFTARTFLARSSSLVALSRETMARLAGDSARETRTVIEELVAHTTDARRRLLLDLPLSLYGGDGEHIRQLIARSDHDKSEQLTRNAEILAQEMERRSLAGVDRVVRELEQQQTLLAQAFAAELRQRYLIVSGITLGALFLLLGFGLYRTVVRPLRELSRATAAVARGDLSAAPAVRSRDEVGDLAQAFAAMVEDLRASHEAIRRQHAELADWNARLEHEVDRKTKHLEEAFGDLRRTQRELVHAEKMASVGRLAGGVAHEFNNLIAGIRGCAREALDTEPDQGRRETLLVITRAASRAAEVTERLLRFSRQKPITKVLCDGTQILRDAVELVAHDARAHDVTVTVDLPAGLNLIADGDALHQVFLNLLRNGLQAMRHGGELSVVAELQGDEVQVSVTDTGCGIPEQELPHVFDPFFTTKDEEADPFFRGSGLGLAVSHSIVEAHGGTITVESELGSGSIFTVRLPLGVPLESKEISHGSSS